MNELVANVGYVLLVINLVLFFIGFSKYGKAYKIFTFYLMVMFVIQMIVNIMNYMKSNNLFLSHFYFILQFLLLSFFYLDLLKNDLQRKVIKFFMIFCPLVLLLQYCIDDQVFFRFNLFEIFITSFLLIIYSTMYLYNMLNEPRLFYYVNIGILIYLFGSTVLFLTGNIMSKLNSSLNQYTWVLNSVLYVVYQLFIFYEWKISRLAAKRNYK